MAFDGGELEHIALYEGLQVRIEECRAVAGGALHCFRESADHCPFEIVPAFVRGRVVDIGAVAERRIDESVRLPIDLALRERPR
ncbi:hypothetical protein [Nocardia flavorosea]|uniref:Uncharacterized protein n=1 Tax=Nocardia flavorosea TaxID=53429 RepID=A0A846YDT4_9NOCA|nr:hypothetical protein [Nocardia flavorosea]NKY55892.1 hypothetical protein [Nocardia flavorosea]